MIVCMVVATKYVRGLYRVSTHDSKNIPYIRVFGRSGHMSDLVPAARTERSTATEAPNWAKVMDCDTMGTLLMNWSFLGRSMLREIAKFRQLPNKRHHQSIYIYVYIYIDI